jgi:hypothetical protein
VALHVLVLPRYLALMPVARVALGLDGGDVIPLSLRDDITDDVFRAGFGGGSDVFVGQGDDRKLARRQHARGVRAGHDRG